MPTVSQDELKDFITQAERAVTESKKFLDSDTSYYEADRTVKALGTSIPPQMQDLSAAVGWARLYLDSLVERLQLEGFRFPGDTTANELFQEWWQVNDLDEEFPILALETFIHGRAYVTVSAPTEDDIEQGYPEDAPIIRLESPRHMWVEIDPRTKRVLYAIRFYNVPTISPMPNKPREYTVYLPNETLYITEERNGKLTIGEDSVVHNLGQVPVIPAFNRERSADLYGTSEIIPELRSLQDVATRVLMNMQAASELMAVPQRLLFGVKKESIQENPDDQFAAYRAYMANILTFGDKDVSAQQFTAAELSNYTTVLQELSKYVASYTGLPPQYLSFSGDNPASADAIRSAEARLVKKCEMKGRMFGNVMERVMRLGLKVMKKSLSAGQEPARLQSILTDPSTPTWAAKADAAQKLVGGKAIIPIEQARHDLGYSPEEREDMKRMDQDEAAELAAAMRGVPSARFSLPTAPSTEKPSDDPPKSDSQP